MRVEPLRRCEELGPSALSGARFSLAPWNIPLANNNCDSNSRALSHETASHLRPARQSASGRREPQFATMRADLAIEFRDVPRSEFATRFSRANAAPAALCSNLSDAVFGWALEIFLPGSPDHPSRVRQSKHRCDRGVLRPNAVGTPPAVRNRSSAAGRSQPIHSSRGPNRMTGLREHGGIPIMGRLGRAAFRTRIIICRPGTDRYSCAQVWREVAPNICKGEAGIRGNFAPASHTSTTGSIDGGERI